MYKKGSFGERLLALIIDEIIVVVVALLFIFSLSLFNTNVAIDDVETIMGFFLVTYNTLFIWRTGTTIGKRLLKLKVVDTEYKPVGFWRALLRESIGKILSSVFNLGYFWMIIDKRKQAWHDKVAGTFVVKLDQNNNLIPIQSEQEVTTNQKTAFILLFLFFGFPILLISSLIIIYLFIAQPHQIVGKAMNPNYANGQYYLTNKITYRINPPKRGEVIIFRAPPNPEVDYFKRIIGLPGEEIEIRENKVYINGNLLSEPYLETGEPTYAGAFLREGQKMKIPENKYIVLGDNRDQSSDSREWGFISTEDIIGRMDLCYYKCSESKR